MNYYQIGQKIRSYRKAQGLSQDALAERIGISVTHMSHIETGNTKLSLPVLADIARTLEVPCDALIFDNPSPQKGRIAELAALLEGCSERELRVIAGIARAAKAALREDGEQQPNP